MSITSAVEARKTVLSKRNTKTAIIRLKTDEPWDTLKAQLLVKINEALGPSLMQYDCYDVKFYIPRVIPKPGLSLTSETEYDVMMMKARKLKDLTINITVVQIRSDDNKENGAEDNDAEEQANSKTKKKYVRPAV